MNSESYYEHIRKLVMQHRREYDTVGFRLPMELIDELEGYCAEQDLNPDYLVEEILRGFLRHVKGPQLTPIPGGKE